MQPTEQVCIHTKVMTAVGQPNFFPNGVEGGRTADMLLLYPHSVERAAPRDALDLGGIYVPTAPGTSPELKNHAAVLFTLLASWQKIRKDYRTCLDPFTCTKKEGRWLVVGSASSPLSPEFVAKSRDFSASCLCWPGVRTTDRRCVSHQFPRGKDGL
jgi:hypothetical protein